MSTNLISSGTTARQKVNLRTPDVMAAVQQQVESHYRSDIIEKVRRAGGIISVGDTTVRLAKQFGFCYGVERAIDLAYAARKVFKDRRLFIVGEIIHNPEVNDQIASLGIKNLTGRNKEADISDLGPDDVVIVPAFGTELSIQQQIKDRGCQIVDTTCGDVMSVWKRVRKYATESVTSIIHGKAEHEETKATSSRALGDGSGHYLVVLTLGDTDYVCDYIRHGGDKQAFLEKFKGAHSPGFDPDVHLRNRGRGESDDNVARRNRGSATPNSPGSDRSRRTGARAEEFPLLRHDLRRYAGAAGCVARIAKCSYGSVARRRRLQQLEHITPRRDGRREVADIFRAERFAARFRYGNQALQLARKTRNRFTLLVAERVRLWSASLPAHLVRTT